MGTVQHLTIAVSRGDAGAVLELVADDVVWDVVGKEQFERREAVAGMVAWMGERQVSGLEIGDVLSHGKAGACSGVRTLGDGKKEAFCDVHIFSSAAKTAKIRRVVSYVIELPG
jgi:hypothetical protein